MRIDGACQEAFTVPAAYISAVVSRVKILASLDISERRKPQDGKISIRLNERDLELRVATPPTVNGEAVVLRLPRRRQCTALQQTEYVRPQCPRSAAPRRAATRYLSGGWPHRGLVKPRPFMPCWAKCEHRTERSGLLRTRWKSPSPECSRCKCSRKSIFYLCQRLAVLSAGRPGHHSHRREMRDKETSHIGVEASHGPLVFSTLHANSAPKPSRGYWD